MVYTNMEQKIAQQVKVSFGEEIRRLSFTGNSFKSLVEEIKKLFNLKDEFPIVVKYLDEDKDNITMSSDEELQTAIALCNGNLLRIQVARKFGKRAKEAEANSNGKEETEVAEAPKDEKHSWRERKDKVKQFREKLHAMQQVRLVKDVTFSDNSSLAPSTQFVKTWKIRNESEAPWPEGCALVFHKGDNMGNSASIPLPTLAPGQEYDVSVNLTSPSTYGKYVGVWRFNTPPFVNWKGETVQKKFGTPLKVKIVVSDSASDSTTSTSISASESDGSSDDERSPKVAKDKKLKKELKQAQREEKRKAKELKKKAKFEELTPLLLQLESMGFTDKQLNIRVLKRTHADLDKAVVKLLKKKAKAQKK